MPANSQNREQAYGVAQHDDRDIVTPEGEGGSLDAEREGDVDLNADIETDRIDYLSPDLDLDAEAETAPEDLQQPRRPDMPRQPQR